jgi:hypothetical protein
MYYTLLLTGVDGRYALQMTLDQIFASTSGKVFFDTQNRYDDMEVLELILRLLLILT